MRIAEIHWAYAPTIGGVETHLAVLNPALARRGHQVALLTGQPENTPPIWDAPDFSIERTPLLDLNRMTYEEFALQADEVYETIENFLVRFEPDVIHLHNFHYFTPIPLEAVTAFRHRHGVPVVLTAHNTWNDPLFEELAAFKNDYDHIIAVSRFIRDDLVRLGYPEAHITSVHHGVTPDWLDTPPNPVVPFAQAAGRPLLFHPARMSFAKGSLVVLEAFARLKHVVPDAFLMMAGTERTVDWDNAQSKEIQKILSRIRELHLENDVAFRAFAWEEMRSLYDAADVVLYPSVFPEPFGIVVIEAMARGKPVVIAKSGGMPELIEHGVSGLVVPPGSVEALDSAMTELMTQPELRERLGFAARQRVRESFTAEQMVDQTETVLVNTLREMAPAHGASLAS